MANIKTGRKQAEQALKVSEEKFSRAFHSNPHPMSIVTMAEGRYLDVNDSYVQTFGFPREELLGRTTVEMGVLKDNNARSKILQLQKEEQALKNLEVEFYTRSGQKIEALLSADKMEIGGQTCLLTVITDVTERKRMEEALRESQELYRAVLELGSRVGEATVLLQDDERGTAMHVYVSDVWCNITGYSREELLDISMADLIHPKDRDAAVARHTRRLGGEDIPGLIEISIIRKNGTEVPVEVTYAHSIYKGKSANVGFIRDVTKRKQAEESIIVANERVQYLLSSSPAVIYSAKTSGDHGATFISNNVTQLVGYEPQEFTGNSSFWIERIHPDDVALVYQEVPRLFEQEQYSYEYRFRRKDGVYIWVSDRMKLVRDEEGKPLEIIGCWTDITERKRAEETLRKSEERLAQLYDEAPVGYHELDSKGRIVQVNRTELDMLGYTAKEMLGKYVWDFMVEMEISRQAFAAKVAGNMLPGQSFERTYRRKDGTTFPVLIEDRYVKDESGQIIGLRSTIQDITERKQAEEKQAELVQELQETLKEIRTLSGLLPICAWCKKLRDDEGYWKSVEQYIGERTKAEFTHGICPECNEKFQAEENRKLNSDTRMNQS